jgi:acyl-CoA thioester hydrolase
MDRARGLDPMFVHSFDVSPADIDGLGHVNNIAYLRWIQEVAVAHSAAVGLDFDAYVKLGAVFVVRRHEVDYLRPVLRGDRIEARTWIDSAMAAKCLRATDLVRVSDGERVAKAMTTWGYVDATTGRPTRIPDGVREAFGMPVRAAGSAPREARGGEPDVEIVERPTPRAE